jgi:hypothetical protein
MIRSTYPDIIFGTETWIDNSIKDSQIFLRGYTIFIGAVAGKAIPSYNRVIYMF